MSVKTDSCDQSTSAYADPLEAFLRRWPRKLLIAYLLGTGSVAIVGACKPWIDEAWTLARGAFTAAPSEPSTASIPRRDPDAIRCMPTKAARPCKPRTPGGITMASARRP